MTRRSRSASRSRVAVRSSFGSALALWGVAAAASPTWIEAQAYRGWVSSSMHAVQLRPVVADTVARAAVTVGPEGAFLFDGYPVQCPGTGPCTGMLPGGVERVVAATHDAGVTYWGLGVAGLSATGLFRVRSRFGGGAWPGYDGGVDAMLAYAQVVRGDMRARVGRQQVRSGLGFSHFDGASASLDRGNLRFEAYGGRSLARGIRQPANEATRAIDDFFVDRGVRLVGAAVTLSRWSTAMTARYHREILADRSGLDGERAAFDFGTTLTRVRVTGSLDYDFSYERVGKAHLGLTLPLEGGVWLVEAGGRRYLPYFELSTIWGFFEPVAYSEGYARVGWGPTDRAIAAWFSAGARMYGDAQASGLLDPLKDTGWWWDVGGAWEPAAGWSLDGRYRLEWGVGALLTTATASLRRQLTEQVDIGLLLSTFQQIEEYRLGEGRGYAIGGDLSTPLTSRIDLHGGFSVTRHRDGGTAFTSPWNQGRAWTSFRWAVGDDPGLRRPGRTP